MSEVPLYGEGWATRILSSPTHYRGTSLMRNTHPPRITIGP